MKTPVDNDLNKAYEVFNQNHDHLRQSLMASLPDRSKQHSRAGRINHALAFIGDTIMRSRITKLAAAAVIIIAACVVIPQFGGSVNSSTVAWADVVTHVAHVDYVHMYYFKSRKGDFFRQFEGWYDSDKMVLHGNGNKNETYDDGRISQIFNEHGMLVSRQRSLFADGQPFLELVSNGLLSDKNEQFNKQIPTSVGDDFLIYVFDPSPKESDWMEAIYITVGKNSLLPIQIKPCHKDGDYDLFIFDYEAPKAPAELFEPPDVGQPNGSGEVVVDGEEVKIDIADAPGLKTATMRLRSRSSDVSGKFYLDITFTTDEGYLSHTHEGIGLKPDEAAKCGTGSADGGLDGWPDGKYRNVRFSPWLRPTDKEDTFIVEIRCFLKTEKN